MKKLKQLDMYLTQVIDLHPLQCLYQLEYIYANHAYIIDVSPLSNLPKLNYLSVKNNKITNGQTLKHHKNFSEYNFSDQEIPTTDELKFYSKILSVHSSHKQIRKIKAENRVSKFRKSMTHQKEYIKFKINEQIQVMNMKIQIIFSQNSYTDQHKFISNLSNISYLTQQKYGKDRKFKCLCSFSDLYTLIQNN
ncbi:leucine-rich_repeat domain-containing protein [Hexamita inflata]|uniref:Leucine-rich repeat domain-containing protein n=1 Tax=Hexamita inflata TaxID=28002 RepID=A0AA86UTX0_9EUKA|nr:leucine-rich repeat domain-containing protein [Hexamita inflata]